MKDGTAARAEARRGRWNEPERVFVALGVSLEATIWAFYLAAIVWWTVDLGLGPLRLVLLGTVLEAVLLVGEVPTGVVADRYSRKWSVVIAYFIMGSSMVLAVATTNYAVMLAAQALFGIGWTFRSGADVAWLTDEVAARDVGAKPDVSSLIIRRHRLGLIGSIGVVLVTMALGQWSLRGVIVITGIWIMLTGVWLAVAMTDHFRAGQPAGTGPGVRTILRDGFATARRVRSVRLLMFVMVLVGLGAEALDRLGVKRFLDDGDFGDDSLLFTGVLFLVLAVLAASVVWTVERAVLGGFDLAALAVVLLVVASVGAFVAALAPVVGIAVGIALQDPCREALDPVSTAWANAHAPDETRATVLSFVSQAHGVGEAAGGVLLASLAEFTGVRAAIFVAAVLWAVAAVVSRLAIDR